MYIHLNKIPVFLSFLYNREMPTTLEKDEIWKNGSSEKINRDRYLNELESAKKKKEKRNKAAEKRAKREQFKTMWIFVMRVRQRRERKNVCFKNLFYDLWFFKSDLLNVL